MDPTRTALPGVDETDPFQELVDMSAAADDAVSTERQRCSDVVQAALEQAALRGLHESSPLVRILASIRHSIEIG
jgi:hypothetical protein